MMKLIKERVAPVYAVEFDLKNEMQMIPDWSVGMYCPIPEAKGLGDEMDAKYQNFTKNYMKKL